MASSLLAQYPNDGIILYEKWVNPQWVRLLDVLQMKVRYSRCIGTELHTEDGRQILDFNSGYCVHNAGHNHPKIKAAIVAELERDGAAMLQTGVPELAGVLGRVYVSAPAAGSPKRFSRVPAARESRQR